MVGKFFDVFERINVEAIGLRHLVQNCPDVTSADRESKRRCRTALSRPTAPCNRDTSKAAYVAPSGGK